MVLIYFFSVSFLALLAFFALKLFEIQRGARVLESIRTALDRAAERAYESLLAFLVRLRKDYSVRVARRFMHTYNAWYSSLGYTTGYKAPKVLAFLEGRGKREHNGNGDPASSFLREVAQYKKEGDGRIEDDRPREGK